MKENKTNEENFKNHLSEFAKSFIEKDWIERWLHFLIEKPDKAFYELVKFERHRNKQTTEYLKDNTLRELLGDDYQNAAGVYFDGRDNPEKLRLSNAFERGEGNDALFSIIEGKLAIFFFHEAEIFICKK